MNTIIIERNGVRIETTIDALIAENEGLKAINDNLEKKLTKITESASVLAISVKMEIEEKKKLYAEIDTLKSANRGLISDNTKFRNENSELKAENNKIATTLASMNNLFKRPLTDKEIEANG